MHNLPRTSRAAALVPVLTLFALLLSAQAPSRRLVHVTVTDPMGRFVTGLNQETFQILENGVSRPITDFTAGSIALAIVGETPLALNGFDRFGDELIQTQSISDALRQLSDSKNVRKALIVTTAAETAGITVPAGIQVVRSNPDKVLRDVLELRNQYLLQFDSADDSAIVEVVLRQPRGMPALRPNLK